MKRMAAVVSSLIVGLVLASWAHAGPFQTRFPYQKQTTLAPGAYKFVFSLWTAPSGGTAVWTSENVSLTLKTPVLIYTLGSGTRKIPATIDFSQPLYIQVKRVGVAKPVVAREPLPVAPYALWSDSAGIAAGGVSTVMLADGAVTNDKIFGPIDAAKISSTDLDADLLDGQHGVFYRDASNINAGALGGDFFSAHGDLAAEGHLGNADGDIAQNNGTLQANLYAARAENADSLGGTTLTDLDQRYVMTSSPSPSGSIMRYAVTTIDTAGNVGATSSITIGVDGLPIASYQDGTNADLKVVHCGNAACTSGNIVTTVDTAGGGRTSITIGADGLPVIAYRDGDALDLKVAHCAETTCATGATLTTVDSDGDVGSFASIALGADGLPVIAYRDTTNSTLKILHCGDAACSTSTTAVADSGFLPYFISITIGTDGFPLVAYQEFTLKDLKVAHCADASCSSVDHVTTLDADGDVGMSPSLNIGSDGLPVMSYIDITAFSTKVAHCGDVACSSGAVINTVAAGTGSTMVIGNDGLPLVCVDATVAHCADVNCSSVTSVATITTASADVTSGTIGGDGLPVFALYDYSDQDLVLARAFTRTLGRR
jgi:predicted regulator of Ras-like GTPase activity (Roadblock/LC7/MglB family)